jgi:hypothetical protein
MAVAKLAEVREKVVGGGGEEGGNRGCGKSSKTLLQCGGIVGSRKRRPLGRI